MLVSLSIATVWLKTVVIYVSRWRNFCIYMWMNIVVKKCSRIFPQLGHTCITIFGLKYLLLRGLDDKILTDNFLTDFGVFPNGDPTFLSNFTSDHTDAKITAVQSHAIKHVHRFQYREIYNYPLYPPYIIERLLIMMKIDGEPGQVTRKGEWITEESCLDPHLPTPLLNCTYSVHIACRYTSHHVPYCSCIAI